MKEFIFCALLGPTLGIVLTLVGCTSFVMKQLDQDIATSTSEPLASFKQSNEHANDFLARNRKDK